MELIRNDGAKIFGQLALAQTEFSDIAKNKAAKAGISKTGKQFGGYQYAELTVVLNAILPALNKNGLFLSQYPDIAEGNFSLITSISNSDGEVLNLGKVNYKVDALSPQDLGSIITYLRRYSLLSCFALGTEDDDAGKATKKIDELEAEKTELGLLTIKEALKQLCITKKEELDKNPKHKNRITNLLSSSDLKGLKEAYDWLLSE